MEERVLKPTDIVISQTDIEGNIIYINRVFCRVSGYERNLLIGKNHNIVRDEDMPKAIFKFLWERLNRGEDSYCFIKNRAKDGRYYWYSPNIPIFQ